MVAVFVVIASVSALLISGQSDDRVEGDNGMEPTISESESEQVASEPVCDETNPNYSPTPRMAVTFDSISEAQAAILFAIPTIDNNPFGEVIEVRADLDSSDPCATPEGRVTQFFGPLGSKVEMELHPPSPVILNPALSSKPDEGFEEFLKKVLSRDDTITADIDGSTGIVFGPSTSIGLDNAPNPGLVQWARDGIEYTLLGVPGEGGTPLGTLLDVARSISYGADNS